MKRKITYIIVIIFIILTILFYLWFHSLNEQHNYSLYLLISLFLAIIFFCLYLYIDRNYEDKKIHYIFAIIASILGFLYIFIAPLFTGSDEHNHFYRIYEISELKLITPTIDGNIGSYLPESLYKTFVTNQENQTINHNTNIKYSDISKKLSIPLNKDITILYGTNQISTKNYANTALYSPVQYFPQIIGITIAKLFNSGPYLMGILTRIFNLAFYVLLGTIALKVIPKNKILILSLLLCPVALSNAATISADGFTISTTILFISLILKHIYDKLPLSKKDYLILGILSLIISNTKIVYFPLIFLLFLIPKQKFSTLKKKIIFLTTIIILSVTINLFWNFLTQVLFDLYYQNTTLQIEFIFNNILSYISITLNTYLKNFITFLEDMVVGNFMYHAQISIFSIISFLYLAIIVIASINKNEPNLINNKNKIIVGIIAFITICLISTALYIQCTANFVGVGNNEIVGIQGRYFLPLVLLLPFILPKTKKIIDNKLLTKGIIFLSLPVFLTMLITFI